MTKRRLTMGLLVSLAVLQWHCIQSYISPYHSPPTGYLVVEGYLTGNAATTIRLTRTQELPGDSVVPVVTGADVRVDGADHSVFPFTEYGNGYYMSPPLNMNPATRYRLHISNVNKEDYVSDYVRFKPTPPIDSVNWTYDTSGINFYVNSHDPSNNTRYYEWKCTETWELASWETSIILYQGDTMAKRTPDQEIDTCWHTDSSTEILIGTSEQLAQDVVTHQHLFKIPVNAEDISIEYSLLVTQYALTDSAFDFLTMLKSNTEQLGGVMDPMPSQLTGNIHCLTNPGEPVIGYISAGTIQQNRTFINHYQLPGWLYYFACPLADIGVRPPDYFIYFGNNPHAYTPIAPQEYDSGKAVGVSANFNVCIDCRTRDPNNSNKKPSFWP